MKKKHIINSAMVLTIVIASCGGNAGKTEDTAQAPPAKATGAEIYNRTCVSCHQSDGMGIANVYPPLAKSDYLADKEKTIAQVIKGSSGEIIVNGNKYNNSMPAQSLNDDEIATVLTYVYGNMGNSGGTISPAEVKAVREKLK